MGTKAVSPNGRVVELKRNKVNLSELVPLNKPFNIKVRDRAERVYITFKADDYGFRSTDYICENEDFPFVIQLLPHKQMKINDKPELDIKKPLFTFDDAYGMIEPYCREQEDTLHEIGRHELRFHNDHIEMVNGERDSFAIQIIKDTYKFLDKVWTANEVTLKAKHGSGETYNFRQAELEGILEMHKTLW